jgi:hypothetical protein
MNRYMTILVVVALAVGMVLTVAPPAQAATITVSGVISSNTTWTNGNVYLVNGDVTVQPGVTLTIQPGAIVKLQGSRRLLINGRLSAVGTPSMPVYFTSYRDDAIGGDTDGGGSSSGSPGDWGWIEFSPTSDDSSQIAYATLRYAGYVYCCVTRGPIYLKDASPTVSNSTMAFSSGDGIYLESVLAPDRSAPTVGGNTFSNNAGASVSVDIGSLPVLSGNTSTGNGTNGMAMRGGTVTANTSWDQTNMVLRLVGDVTVGNGATLTIAPGMILKMDGSRRIIVDGRLTAVGTADQPITITSYRDDSVGGNTNGGGVSTGAPGDWGWIEFNAASDDSSFLQYIRLSFGGYVHCCVSRGQIVLLSASPGLDHVTLSRGSQDGLYAETSEPVLACVDLVDNDSHGIRNTTPSTLINAVGLFWGDPTGPKHTSLNPSGRGNEVSAGVSFVPWATAPCFAPPQLTVYLPSLRK